MSNQLTLLNTLLDDYHSESQLPNTDEAFEVFSTEQVLKRRDLTIDEVKTGIIGGSHDCGIDGLFIFLNDELINDIEEVEVTNQVTLEVNFLQYKNSANVKENVIDKFIVASNLLFDLDVDTDELKSAFNSDLVDRIELLHTIIKKVASKHPLIKINFYHVCKGDRENVFGPTYTNESYLRKINILRDRVLESNLGNMRFDYFVMDAGVLLELSRKMPTYSLDLKLNENPIAIDYADGIQRGYIASVNMADYFNFLSDPSDNTLRKYLFESNIRDYQNRSIVNNDIEKTINDEVDYDFWWLNNGVTIIADNGTLVGKKLHLDNIQIVNGLQTSYTIYNTLANGVKDLEARSILLKIIISDKKETVDAVIKSTNSQNPVPPSLLRATHEVQRNIEEYFLANGYYYDRRKNYYRNQKKPVKRIISINYLSQCLTSILEKNPSKARSNPTILTKKEPDYNRLFPDSRRMEVYLSSIKITKRVEQFIKETLTPIDEIEVAISTYYTFHIARVLVSVLLNGSRYNDRDVTTINADDINDATIESAFMMLKDLVISFQRETNQTNLTYISKQIPLSEHITQNIGALLI